MGGDAEQLGTLKTHSWEKASSGGHHPSRTDGVSGLLLAIT